MKTHRTLVSTVFVGLLVGSLIALSRQPLVADSCEPSSSCYVDAGQNLWFGEPPTADYCTADWNPDSGCDMGTHFCSGCTPGGGKGGDDLNTY